MSRVAYAVRLSLPEHWYEVGRDDPDQWLATLVRQLLDTAPAAAQDRLAGALVHAIGLVDMTGPLDALVHVPQPERDAVTAVLLTYPFKAGGLFRRGLDADAGALEQALRDQGADAVAAQPCVLASGPAVRLRAVVRDEVHVQVEQVLHVVRPPDLPVSVMIRMQWEHGHPRAEQLAAQADDVARDALVEVLG